MDDIAPTLYDVQVPIFDIVTYLDEIEEKLSEKTDFPIKLFASRRAHEASMILAQLIQEERDRNRYWKHREPDDTVVAFAKTVRALIDEHGFSWEELAERLGFPSNIFRDVRTFAEEES